jgi:hypothetical protein
MMLSSYPTSDLSSTVHHSYATVNDMSNISMSKLLIKLEFNVVNVRKTGTLIVDVFPRRLDRKTTCDRS